MSSFEHAQPAKNLPMRGNVTSGMDRIQNMPRCRLYSTAGSAGFGPGSANYTFNTVDYDTDGMATLPTFITIRTAGVYSLQAEAGFDSGTGARWSQIILNNNSAQPLADVASTSSSAFGPRHSLHGQFPLNAGDTLSLFLTTVTDTAIMGAGRYRTSLAACLISTL